jgi:pimeloyl-ACP methyl ester carboxylesterase
MSKVLLVHGSCHGAWCFRDVIPALAALGHQAHAIDLPGHGDNPAPIETITLDAYRDAILDAIDEPVYLLGHSMAGYPISAAADHSPDKIKRLIYLCAYAAQNGKSLVDMRKEAPRQPLMQAITRTDDGLGFTVNLDQIETVFYHDCPADTIALARENLCVQAIAPQATPINLSHQFERVRKTYIRCENDQTIPPEYQLTMVQDWDQRDVYHMPTSHSPFFADPQGLAQLIHDIIEKDQKET